MPRDVLHRLRPILIAQRMSHARDYLGSNMVKKLPPAANVAERRAAMEANILGVADFTPLLEGTPSGYWYADALHRFVFDPEQQTAWHAIVRAVCADPELDDIVLAELLVGVAHGYTRAEQFYPLIGLPWDMIDRMMGNLHQKHNQTT